MPEKPAANRIVARQNDMCLTRKKVNNMKKMLITNCPNCGGELPENGNCKYCGTKVRFENELNIDEREPVEILIKRTSKGSNGENILSFIPFRGFLISLDYEYPVLDCFCLSDNMYTSIQSNIPNVTLTFNGTILR